MTTMETRRSRAKIQDVREQRATATPFELRKANTGDYVLEGYASTWEAYDCYGGVENGGWVEQLHKRAFDRTLAENPDLQLLINHEGMPLARTKSGTLELSTDRQGLKVRAYLDPRDPDVQALLPKMERGDMDEMSFAFRVKDQEWNNDFTHRMIREVSLQKGDVSVVNYGMNPTTKVSLMVPTAVEALSHVGERELAELRKLPKEELDSALRAIAQARGFSVDEVRAARANTERRVATITGVIMRGTKAEVELSNGTTIQGSVELAQIASAEMAAAARSQEVGGNPTPFPPAETHSMDDDDDEELDDEDDEEEVANVTPHVATDLLASGPAVRSACDDCVDGIQCPYCGRDNRKGVDLDVLKRELAEDKAPDDTSTHPDDCECPMCKQDRAGKPKVDDEDEDPSKPKSGSGDAVDGDEGDGKPGTKQPDKTPPSGKGEDDEEDKPKKRAKDEEDDPAESEPDDDEDDKRTIGDQDPRDPSKDDEEDDPNESEPDDDEDDRTIGDQDPKDPKKKKDDERTFGDQDPDDPEKDDEDEEEKAAGGPHPDDCDCDECLEGEDPRKRNYSIRRAFRDIGHRSVRNASKELLVEEAKTFVAADDDEEDPTEPEPDDDEDDTKPKPKRSDDEDDEEEMDAKDARTFSLRDAFKELRGGDDRYDLQKAKLPEDINTPELVERLINPPPPPEPEPEPEPIPTHQLQDAYAELRGGDGPIDLDSALRETLKDIETPEAVKRIIDPPPPPEPEPEPEPEPAHELDEAYAELRGGEDVYALDRALSDVVSDEIETPEFIERLMNPPEPEPEPEEIHVPVNVRSALDEFLAEDRKRYSLDEALAKAASFGEVDPDSPTTTEIERGWDVVDNAEKPFLKKDGAA